MRRIANLCIFIATGFLATVAVIVNSPGLFYMATALTAMILVSHYQSWRALKGLSFYRKAVSPITVGDWVTVEVGVDTSQTGKRPLITIWDNIPKRLVVSDRTTSLPVAPSSEDLVYTQYRMKPSKRGIYRWSSLTAYASDTIGLVNRDAKVDTEVVELIVRPKPLPIEVNLPEIAGLGTLENESGTIRGAGLEPRGLREYGPGDSLRFIHWRSTARAGRLLVKEFEGGSHSSYFFVLDESDTIVESVLDMMSGHAATLIKRSLYQGLRVQVPGVSFDLIDQNRALQEEKLLDYLAGIQPRIHGSVSKKLAPVVAESPNAGFVAFIGTVDMALTQLAAQAKGGGGMLIALLYGAASTDLFAGTLRSAGAYVVQVTGDESGQ